jgi:hypothetical protein
MLNLFSTFNTAYVGQTNYQGAANTAWNSPLAYQAVGQNAANGATVIQLG